MNALHPQLRAICDEFDQASVRLRALARNVPEPVWTRRPDPTRWSAAECIAHLNLTSLAYLPLLDEGLARARDAGGPAPGRYHRDLAGWLLWKTMGPPARFRTRTTAAFVPSGKEPPTQLVPEFERLQGELLTRVRQANGLPIDRIKIPSPFNARLKYNLFAAMTILPPHEHRHLWQAERAWQALAKSPR
jgi:DinB superfamily